MQYDKIYDAIYKIYDAIYNIMGVNIVYFLNLNKNEFRMQVLSPVHTKIITVVTPFSWRNLHPFLSNCKCSTEISP